MNENPDNYILNLIRKEVEERFNCCVQTIHLDKSDAVPEVYVHFRFRENYISEPFRHFSPTFISFSEKAVHFHQKADWFNCIRELGLFD